MKPSYDAYRLPIVREEAAAAASGSGAACGPAPASAPSSCSAWRAATHVERRRAREHELERLLHGQPQLEDAPPTASPAFSDAVHQPGDRHEPRGEAAEVRGRTRTCPVSGRSCSSPRSPRSAARCSSPPARWRPRGSGRCSRTTRRSCRLGRRSASSTLNEIKELGRRHAAHRGEVERGRARARARRRSRTSTPRTRPPTRATPNAYPGFGPLRRPDRSAHARWASGSSSRSPATRRAGRRTAATARASRPPTYRPSAGEYAQLRGRGREALLRQLRRPAGGLLLLDLERAQPPPLHQAAPRARPASTATWSTRRSRRSARRTRARRSSSARRRRSAARRRRWARRSSSASGCA